MADTSNITHSAEQLQFALNFIHKELHYSDARLQREYQCYRRALGLIRKGVKLPRADKAYRSKFIAILRKELLLSVTLRKAALERQILYTLANLTLLDADLPIVNYD